MLDRISILTLVVLGIAPLGIPWTASAQTTWYVDDDAPNDPAPGDPTVSDPLEDGSPEHPFDAIQEGIDAAVDGDQVVICDGTYTGDGNKNLHFDGKAITLRSATGYPGTCVIDCESQGRGFYFQHGEDADSVVDGLSVTNGNVPLYGGGIRCDNSNPTIVNCCISHNTTCADDGGGGGVYCSLDSTPTFTDCTIQANSVFSEDGRGGGVYCSHSGHALFTNCTILANSVYADDGRGGGVYCSFSSPIFIDCTISDNAAFEDGGGIGCYMSRPTLTSCTIYRNTTCYNSGGARGGGGISCSDRSYPAFTNCTINANVSVADGGGVYSRYTSEPTFLGCTINDNCAVDHGGGVACHYSSAILADCVISENASCITGGGVQCWYSSPLLGGCLVNSNSTANGGGGMWSGYGSPATVSCTFSGNVAQHGGGIYCRFGDSSPVLMNCLVSDNAAYLGGGVYCEPGIAPLLSGCTITGNGSYSGGGVYCSGSSPIIANCILWYNVPSQIHGSSALVMYSDAQGGWPGQGNIDANPLYVDPDGGDFHLQLGSPCIDAADNTAVPADVLDLDGDGDTDEPTPFDLDARLRFADRIAAPDTGNPDPNFPDLPIVDMGAYEYQCTGDLDGSGQINLADLAQLLGGYGETAGMTYYDGDLDGDGDIDLADLAELLGLYGTVCE